MNSSLSRRAVGAGLVPALVLAIVFLSTLLCLARAATAQESKPAPFYIRPTVIFNEHLYEGALQGPMSVFYDRKARELWVTDTKNNIIGVFSADGIPLFAFESNELKEPARVAVDGVGRVYVIDNDRSKIKLFSYRGSYLGPLDLPGVGEKPVFTSLAFDPDGNLYVGESESCRVLVYGPDRKLKLRLGECGLEQGQFQAITGIAADKDRIVVADAQGVSVQVFDRKGDFVRGWGRHDMGIQNFSLPQSVALDSQGHVIVIDMLRHEIKFFDGEGNFLDRFGGLGTRAGQVAFPSAVATDENGRLFVAERGNSRISAFVEVEGRLEPSARKPADGTSEPAVASAAPH